MDRKIEPKKGFSLVLSKKAMPYWLGALVVVFVIYLLLRDDVRTFRVNADTVSVSEVISGEFNDYIRVSGQVQPMTTIQISPLESGVVHDIFIEEGAKVKAGDKILELKNENLDMQILNSEADLAEKENLLRNTLISMEQEKLSVHQEMLQLQMEVKRYRRAYEAQKELYQEDLIAKETYELAESRLELVKNRAIQDSLYRSVQVKQMQESLNNMRVNMQMIRRRKEHLMIVAPIDGELGLLDAVLGQSVSINNLGSYKIEAQIDEHYIDRVMPGLEAQFERQDESYSAVIRKVYPEVRDGKFKADFKFNGAYPEVRDGKFKADFKFNGAHPENIRTGQTYNLNLQLGQPEEAVMIPRGTFYQKTGGKWIYVLTPEGDKAFKREIHIGRQNPQYYEVLGWLESGRESHYFRIR